MDTYFITSKPQRNAGDAVSDSFARCGKTSTFYESFYELFLGKCPEARRFFTRTDCKIHERLLQATLKIMVSGSDHDVVSQSTGTDVTEGRSRTRSVIKPSLRDVWLESLCETVRRHDPLVTSELEKQWKQRMKQGIDFIFTAYHSEVYPGFRSAAVSR